MEIQKYNVIVIVYIMLVQIDKPLRIKSCKQMGTVFHGKVQLQVWVGMCRICVTPVKPCKERAKVSVNVVLRSTLVNIRNGQRIGVGVFLFFFNMEVLIM